MKYTVSLHPVSHAWSKLWQALFNPKLDPEELDGLLRSARDSQPLPVIWLLGNTQSGKTAIVRAMTGSTSAALGNGFQACTRTTQFYDFPQDAPLVRFLDTRGLEEVNYDPTEDLAFCEMQSHIVLAVVRAMEAPSKALLSIVSEIRKRQPDRPIVIAQTCLHEGYPRGGRHIFPYPFQSSQWPDTVPTDLRRSLANQRASFARLLNPDTLTFVPVDLTSDAAPMDPRDYGLSELWDALEQDVPRGLRQLLTNNSPLKDAKAHTAEMHIRGYAATAVALGAIPVAGAVGVPTIQAKMLHSVAAIFDMDLDMRLAGEFMTALGSGIAIGFGVRWAGREIIKLVPAWGQTAGAVWAAVASGAATYALGQAASFYFNAARGGGRIDEEELRRVYKDAFKRARTFVRSNRVTDGA